MAYTIQDVAKVDVVLVGVRLLGTPRELEEFRRTLDTDVQVTGTGLVANVNTGVTEPGHSLALNRDRITLELSRSRSSIAREYPNGKTDLLRLAKVIWHAIDESEIEDQQLRAYGFNIEIVFNQSSETPAFGYLSERLFDADPLGNEGWRLVGGAGRLIFQDGVRRWTVNMEPRFNNEEESRVFLGVNLHMNERNLPNETELITLLDELWDESHDFVERLDSKNTNDG